MTLSLLSLLCLSFQLAFAAKVACDAGKFGDDTQVLLQTGASVHSRKATTGKMLADASSQQEQGSTEPPPPPPPPPPMPTLKPPPPPTSPEKNSTQQKPMGNNSTMKTSLGKNSTNSTEQNSTAKNSTKKHSSQSVNTAVLDRPNVGKGPTIVTFGILGKTFYGVNVMKNAFTIDVVLTLTWNDPRTVKLIPKGSSTIQLSQEEASKEVWLPEIVVTDQAVHNSVQVVSTAVILHEDGHVVKVQRVEVEVDDKYNLKEYPFDSQPLLVKIASSQYMSSALKLVPSSDEAYSGITAKLFDGSGWDLTNWNLNAIEDNNGLLKKSRGILTINVKRDFGSYRDAHLIPTIYIALLACGVFFFPFYPMVEPFIDARLGMSIVSYLVFTHLKGKSESALPATAPTTWNDVLNTNILCVMVVGVFINVYVEYRFHMTKVHIVAAKFNAEMRLLLPMIFAAVITTVELCGANHFSQGTVDITIKIALAVLIICYVVKCENATRAYLRTKPEGDEEEEEEED